MATRVNQGRAPATGTSCSWPTAGTLALLYVLTGGGCGTDDDHLAQSSRDRESRPGPSPHQAPGAPDPSSAKVGQPPMVREGFSGITATGVRTRAQTFERGALVNLWASWCGSCKQELPMLQQVAEAYGPHGLGLITVTADTPEALPKARQLLQAAGLDTGDRYYLAGRVSVFKRDLDRRWKGAIPATFLLDGTGRVRYFWNGPVLADEIREIVQRYLAGESVDGMTDLTVGQPRP